MKDRMTLGFGADVAETAALTVPDDRATDRIVEAVDWEQDKKAMKNRIDAAVRCLPPADRAFARAVLDGKGWQEMGLPRSTFSDRLKKTEKLLAGA